MIDDLLKQLADEDVDFNDVLTGMRMDLTVEFEQDADDAADESEAKRARLHRNIMFETKFRILNAFTERCGPKAKLLEIPLQEIGITPFDKNQMGLLKEKNILEVITHLQFRIIDAAAKKLLSKLPSEDLAALNQEYGDVEYELVDRFSEEHQLPKWID